MDNLTAFFIIALTIAIFTTICVLVKFRKERKKEVPEKPVSPVTPPRSVEAASVSREIPPANVSVIYEGLRSHTVTHCRSCGCEYGAAVMVCEICGEKLYKDLLIKVKP